MPKTAHQSGIRMSEGVEAIAARNVDSERAKQGSELPFQQQVLIPRRSSATREKHPTCVRMAMRSSKWWADESNSVLFGNQKDVCDR